jgi:hypothetical protein
LIATLQHERAQASGREEEHRQLLQAMREQTAAAEKSARIAAISARIDGYTLQMEDFKPGEDRNRMYLERESLLRELDRAYQNFAAF